MTGIVIVETNMEAVFLDGPQMGVITNVYEVDSHAAAIRWLRQMGARRDERDGVWYEDTSGYTVMTSTRVNTPPPPATT